MIYSDHRALLDIFSKGDSTKAWINIQLDQLSKFDLKVVHRLLRDQYIGLADGLSRMPTRYLSPPVEEELSERIPIRATIPIEVQSKPVSILDSQIDKKYKKYQDLLMYLGLVEYLQKGLPALEGLNCNQKRQLIRKI